MIRQEMSEITNNITIDNNIIRDAGHVFPCAVGIIIFNASDNKLTHNEIADLRYSGISVGWVWGYAHSPSKRNMIELIISTILAGVSYATWEEYILLGHQREQLFQITTFIMFIHSIMEGGASILMKDRTA